MTESNISIPAYGELKNPSTFFVDCNQQKI